MESSIRWDDINVLPVVTRVRDRLAKRFRLGLGIAAADGQWTVAPERAGHDGVCEAIQASERGKLACQTFCTGTALKLARQPEGRAPLVLACHAALSEIVVPIRVGSAAIGAVTAGGFLPADEALTRSALVERAVVQLPLLSPAKIVESEPRLSVDDLRTVGELLQLVADDISAFVTAEQASEKAIQLAAQARAKGEPDKGARSKYPYDAIIGQSRPLLDIFRLLDRVVDSDTTVLIGGENGTGKELIAKAIHYNSARRGRRFVVQNCSAFNDNLLDSELFGHKRGSFTGAVNDKQGLFEAADGGTFFLDEIGDMSPALQVKLLRVLQEGTFMPVGDTESKQVDVRIIAASNKDLKKMVERGEFREDLYYRVNVIHLTLPPLRERIDDIPLLIDYFLKRHSRGRRGPLKRLTSSCLAQLQAYAWPGNIRELENEIERLVVLAGDDGVINEELLSQRIRDHLERVNAESAPSPGSLPSTVELLERQMIVDTLAKHQGNKTRAAKELQVSRRNLIRKVAKYNLQKPARK